MRPARGFTLVEVMVALAIVAVALPALLTTLYRQADDTAYLRDKMLAQMVAANRLAETRLVVRASRQLQPGEDSGQAPMAERDWFWWQRTEATNVADFYRIEIQVADREDRRERPLYTLVAFMSADLKVDEVPLEGGPGGPGEEQDEIPADDGAQPAATPRSDGNGDPTGGDTGIDLPVGNPGAVESFVD